MLEVSTAPVGGRSIVSSLMDKPPKIPSQLHVLHRPLSSCADTRRPHCATARRVSEVRCSPQLACCYAPPACFRAQATCVLHQALPSASFRFYTASNNDLPAIRRHGLHPVASRDPSRAGRCRHPGRAICGKSPKDCGAPVTSTKKGAERRDLPLDSDVCTRRLY